jgi:phage terminase small subunit
MNVYTIYSFRKEDTNKMEDGKHLIVSPLDAPEEIAVHGAEAWQRAWDLLKSGKSMEEVDEMLCHYCCEFWDEHTQDQKVRCLQGQGKQ